MQSTNFLVGNTRAMHEICSKTLKRHENDVNDATPVPLLFALNRFHTLLLSLYC